MESMQVPKEGRDLKKEQRITKTVQQAEMKQLGKVKRSCGKKILPLKRKKRDEEKENELREIQLDLWEKGDREGEQMRQERREMRENGRQIENKVQKVEVT